MPQFLHHHKPLSSWLTFAIVSLITLLLCIKGGNFGYIGEHPLFSIPSGKFILLFVFTGVLSVVMLLLFPRGLSKKNSVILILLLATLCRIALINHEACDDLNRYLWEGRILQEGISPYHYAPNSPELSSIAENDPIFKRINHADMPAIYPPFTLYLFSLVTSISYTPLAMKIISILFDLGTLAFLFMLLHHRRLNPRWAILYAFNPVILYSFAGQGHFDSMQLFFLMGAIYFYDRKWWAFMFLFAGLAIQTKYVAIITLPFFLTRENAKYLPIAIITVTLPYIGFVKDDDLQILFSLRQFGEEFAFNGSMHAILRALFGNISSATTICKVLLIVSLIFGYGYFHPNLNRRFANDPISGCFFAFGVLIIFSPTIHFWYISWIIPFLVLRPTASWIVLSLTISGYFVANGYSHHTGKWYLPAWAYFVQWLPFYLLLLRDIYLAWHRSKSPIDNNLPKSVSVIIPARNEAENIDRCIKQIRSDKAVFEVIVVDGGSTDQTVSVAEKAGAIVLNHSGGGRGGQIHAGILKAEGDVIAIIHADILVTDGLFSQMIDVLQGQPVIVGGAVGGVFDGIDWRLRMLEFANDFRMVCTGISFGDQVQFFRRKPIVEMNLFPDIPLMEDVEFGLRLHKAGRQILLFGDVMISSRRWEKAGYGRSILVIKLVSNYLWQRLRGKPDTQAMYNRYYK